MNARLPALNAFLTLALAGLYLAWWLFDGASLEALPVTTLIVAVAPLLLLLPGLWQGRRFATTLAGLLIPFHFAYAVMELIANPGVRGWVAAQTFLTFVLFALLMASLRQVRSD